MRDIIETIEHKGYSINIYHDDSAENPFESWDCNYPLLVETGNRWTKEVKEYAEIRYYLAYEAKKDSWFIYHQKKLQEILECDFSEDCSEDRIYNIQKEIEDCVDVNMLEDIANMMKIPCYAGTSSGYSQGDCRDVFVCWTPEFEKTTGVTIKQARTQNLESTADLWGYWAWGDVYGYEVVDENDEELDSCWGFYGNDHKESGLLESAIDAIEHRITQKEKERVAKLKTLISNRVPLSIRLPYQY